MKPRTISIDKEAAAVQRFFHKIRDEPVVIEHEGRTLCVLYPAARLSYPPEGQLKDAAGAWQLPEEVVRAISGETS
ncbi:MAG TPA: hypothetical protein VNK04_22530 [Gemmataceae bacterium]|nr:hypothetical protein [Gemmataceae bacterium]